MQSKKHLFLVLIAAVFFAVSHSHGKAPIHGMFFSQQFEKSKVVTDFNIVYGEKTNQAGDRATLKLDLYSPPIAAKKKRLPLIILIHGGGFINGSKEKHQNWAYEYASFGYKVACINYRLTPAEIRNANPQNFITAATHATEDGMDAIRFLKLNADKFGIDAHRIATIGMSAGGWVSTLNAIEFDTFNQASNSFSPTSSKVNAAIATGVSLADDDTCKLIRDTLLTFDRHDTPTLLFHSERSDRVTTATWSEAVRLADLINDSGNSCEIHKQPGHTHTDKMNPSGEYWPIIASFLKKQLDL